MSYPFYLVLISIIHWKIVPSRLPPIWEYNSSFLPIWIHYYSRETDVVCSPTYPIFRIFFFSVSRGKLTHPSFWGIFMHCRLYIQMVNNFGSREYYMFCTSLPKTQKTSLKKFVYLFFCTRKLLNISFNINVIVLEFLWANRNTIRMFVSKFEQLTSNIFFK